MNEAVKPENSAETGAGILSGATRLQAPDLSRLLSISSIIVALVVAASLTLDGVLSRGPVSLAPKTTEVATAAPTPEPNLIRTDETRIQHLEQRLILLEQQIILLQTQVVAEHRQSTALREQFASLQNQVMASDDGNTDDIVVGSVSEPAPAPESSVETPHARRPVAETAATEDIIIVSADPTPEPAQPDADAITTGSVDPAAATTPVNTPNQDLTDLVKPAVRKPTPNSVSRTRFALALELHDSIDDVKAAWKALVEEHAEIVYPFDARALPQGTQEGDLKYRLLVGPIENVADAARRCARLSRTGIACKAAVYSGEPLEIPPSPGTLIQVEMTADDGASVPVQPLPDPNDRYYSAKMRALIANAPVPRPKPKPAS